MYQYSKYLQFHTHHQTEMSSHVQCLLCPVNIIVDVGSEAKLEKHIEEKHSVGFEQKGFILALHLLTKTEVDRIELWMASRKLELSKEEEKKEEDNIEQDHPSKDDPKGISKSSNIDTDFILIDDEDEEIECCYDSKEQSLNALRSTLFSQTPIVTNKQHDKSSSSLELPYRNKTVLTKMRPGRSILKGQQTNNEKLAELFDAKVALAKLLKKINESEKHSEAEEAAAKEKEKKDGVLSSYQSIETDDEKEGVVDIEQQIEREKSHEEKAFEELDSEEEAKAEDAEQEGDVEQKEDVEDIQAEGAEDIQARPFNSNVPNLIFSTLF